MAEADPGASSPSDSCPNVQTKSISVLLLATRWTFDTFGLSTVNKSLVNNLREVDPDGQTIKITCAVLEENDKINQEEIEDAAKYRVELRGAKQRRGNKAPCIEWMEESTAAYYRHLVQESKFDYIVGHVPYLVDACFHLKDLSKERGVSSQVVLMVHVPPRTEDGDVNYDLLYDWLGEADVVFPIGQAAYEKITSCVEASSHGPPPVNKMYIAAYPKDLFADDEKPPSNSNVRPNITVITGEKKNSDVSGFDFPLAVSSTAAAAKYIQERKHRPTTFVLLAAKRQDKEGWKLDFQKVVNEGELKYRDLTFECIVPESIKSLKTELRRSNLILLPLKPKASEFGTEVLVAVAAGIPVLVSHYSGFASLLQTMAADQDAVVSQSDVDSWKSSIADSILEERRTRSKIAWLRKHLPMESSITSTHLEFMSTISSMEIWFC